MKRFYYIVEPTGVDEKHPYWVPKQLELLIGDHQNGPTTKRDFD